MHIKGLAFTAAAVFALMGMSSVAQATQITPSFDNAPTGWISDRKDPGAFHDIGPFQGRDHVLEVGINPWEFQADNFYNTEGKGHLISGGAGSMISADLWIPSDWANDTAGDIRAGLWGVMTDGSPDVSGYPILEFATVDGDARFRWWEDDTGTWTDASVPVVGNTWNTLGILFTGSTYQFFVNGTQVGEDTTTNGSTGFQEMILQTTNYGQGLEVDWTNTPATPAPEPASLALLGAGLAGVGFMRRKKLTGTTPA